MNFLTKNVYFIENKKFKATQENKLKLAQKVQEKIDQSERINVKYNLKDKSVGLLFNNSVRRIGLARLNPHKNKLGYDLLLEININAFNEDPDFILEKIVAHEVAHLVCYVNYAVNNIKIRPHGKEFKYICEELGGVSDVKIEHFKTMRNSENSRKSRAIYRYIYKSNDGEEVMLSKKSHYMLAGGLELKFKNSKTKKIFVLNSSNFLEKRNMRPNE